MSLVQGLPLDCTAVLRVHKKSNKRFIVNGKVSNLLSSASLLYYSICNPKQMMYK